MPSANDIQHGGDHYKGAKFQHWDLIAKCHIGYLEGCATKYASRWRKKNGIEDLNKAIHYVDKLIECVKEGYRPTGCALIEDLTQFFQDNDIQANWEKRAIQGLCTWTSLADIGEARSALFELLAIAQKQADNAL